MEQPFRSADLGSEVAGIVSAAAAAHIHDLQPGEQAALTRPDRLTPDERQERGRSVRKQHPRSELGAYELRHDCDIALELLRAQEVDRVQALLPLRHERMTASPFTFFRGSAIVMAHDLARSPHTGLTAQLCGDAHMLNFGIFAAPDRSTIFDINDFDETHPGPFEWDLQRLFTSIVLAGEDRGMVHNDISNALRAAITQYIHGITHYASEGELDIWYSRTTVAELVNYVKDHRKPGLEKAIAAAIQESQRKDMWSAIDKFTVMTPQGRIFRSDPPVLERIPMDHDIRVHVETLFAQYKSTLAPSRRQLLDKYEILDIGHKVVGVGSVGLLAFVTLLRGRDDSDLLVLQSKQAVESVIAPHVAPVSFPSQGQRVVDGQQIMQSASDSFLGWYPGREGRSFYTRQLRDKKGSINLKTLTPDVLSAYGSLCANTLARAHARSGDPIAIMGYLGQGKDAVDAFTHFAFAYRTQVHFDYEAFRGSLAS